LSGQEVGEQVQGSAGHQVLPRQVQASRQRTGEERPADEQLGGIQQIAGIAFSRIWGCQ